MDTLGANRNLATSPVTVASLIDSRAVGALQYRAFSLAALSLVVEGYDTQAVAYIAPILSKEWSLPTGAFGPVFAAGLIGSALGSIALAPLADRAGRKSVLVAAAVAVGIMTLLCTSAQSLHALEWLRLFSGLGLGAALPNALALISEYAPERKRTSIVAVTFSGLAVGAALGGVVATQLVPLFGWRAVFAAGGIATLLLCPLLLWKLPESLRYLVLRDSNSRQARATLRQLVGAGSSDRIELVAEQQVVNSQGARPLLGEGRAVATITYACLAFFTLLTLYLLNNWLPTLIHAMGFPINQAAWATAAFQLGGILGAVTLGLLADRLESIRVVVTAYLAAAAIIASIAFAQAPTLVALAAFGAGFMVVGAQSCNNAMLAGVYPTACRGRALGVNLTIGRIGSILGPAVTGWLLLLQIPPQQVLLLAAVPALIAAVSLYVAADSIRRLAQLRRAAGG